MLFPIIQALWQQFGPQIQQTVPYILKNMQHIPGSTIQITRFAIHAASEELQSLSDEDKEKLKRAGVWLVKDMGGDIATAVTGLPIGPLVDLSLGRLFPDENDQK